MILTDITNELIDPSVQQKHNETFIQKINDDLDATIAEFQTLPEAEQFYIIDLVNEKCTDEEIKKITPLVLNLPTGFIELLYLHLHDDYIKQKAVIDNYISNSTIKNELNDFINILYQEKLYAEEQKNINKINRRKKKLIKFHFDSLLDSNTSEIISYIDSLQDKKMYIIILEALDKSKKILGDKYEILYDHMKQTYPDQVEVYKIALRLKGGDARAYHDLKKHFGS
jgi:hypothetical protein